MNIRPLLNSLAVREIETPTFSPGGIFIGQAPSDTGFVKGLERGEVLAVGPGLAGDDMWDLKAGDMVHFSPVGKVCFEIEGSPITMIRRDAIVGVDA